MPRGGPKPGRSFADLQPAQAAEWHPTLNGDLIPVNVSPGNNSKVWWKCGRCAGDWQAVINNRSAKNSLHCVDCNRGLTRRRQLQAMESPEQSLAVAAPDLATEFHPEKNKPLTPESTPLDWDHNLWWKCTGCDHVWQLPPKFRLGAGPRGCPKCAEHIRPLAENSLAETHANVAQQWHPTENGNVTPGAFTAESAHEVWWLCPQSDCGHKWFAPIATRTAGKRRGCPSCQRPDSEIPIPGESLGDLYPNVAAEWHPDLNGRLDPFNLKPRSKRKVWWLCAACQTTWLASVANRTANGTGCNPCSYAARIAVRDRPEPGRSLADKFVQLVLEWDGDRNDRSPGELKPGSDYRAWWKCARGHEWQAHVYARTGGEKTGCPVCRDLPEAGQSVGELRPDLVQQWHPTLNGDRTPFEFSLGSAFLATWQCSVGHVWDARITNRAKPNGSGCTQCRTWGTSQQQIRLAHELEAAGCPVQHDHPRIPVEGRAPVNADIVLPAYNTVVEFDGSHYHEGAAAASRDKRQTRALESAGWNVIRVRPAPLEALRPADVLLADGRDTKRAVNGVIARLMADGHLPARAEEYLSDPTLWAVTQSDKEIQERFGRSVATLHPEVAADWHPTLNGERRPEMTNPGSRDTTWWLCSSCSHVWKTSPKKRTTDNSGCPKCATRRRATTIRKPRPGHSVAERFPHLLELLHPTKNGDISLWNLNYGTTTKLFWLCPRCGNEWTTHTPRNTGCRTCGAKDRGRRQSSPTAGDSLTETHPELAREWHPSKNGDLLPTQLRADSSRQVWWLCGVCQREWKRSPGNRAKTGAGCRRCSSRSVGAARRAPGQGQELVNTHPSLAGEWIVERNPSSSPETIRANSTERAWWRCRSCGNEWNARIDTRALRGHGCKKCASSKLSETRRRPKPGRSLADVKPHLLPLWHEQRNGDLKPTDLTPSSHTRVWWRCPTCQHEWQSSPGSPGCKPCGQKRSGIKQLKPKVGCSLLERFPMIAEQWDVSRNAPFTPADIGASSNQYFWWCCANCQHRWNARPSTRITSAYLCPHCRYQLLVDR